MMILVIFGALDETLIKLLNNLRKQSQNYLMFLSLVGKIFDILETFRSFNFSFVRTLPGPV